MSGDLFFSWEEVEANREAIDCQIHYLSMKYAQLEYIDHAKSCPKCGESPDNLFWLGIQSPNELWDKGAGKAGFLTICEKCHLQVDFFRDVELEKEIIKGRIRL